MTYEETLDYLYTRLPMFTRIGKAAYKADLNNTLALCKALDNPEKKFKSLHIAGTNGKGSTSHMLASVLQESGFKTGLYTSPHLKDFRERIRINGQMIPKQYVLDFVEKHQDTFEAIAPSFFEWTVALCFDYFAQEKVDIAIIETGLGGRLDSTNVIIPELCVITNIGYDHTDLLGDSLALIAAEKAGIIKPRVPVVVGEKRPETLAVFKEKASLEKAPLFWAEEVVECNYFQLLPNGCNCDVERYGKSLYKDLFCDLGGLYQQKNLVSTITAIALLKERGYKLPETDIRQGLARVKTNTGLMGRWQVLHQKPLVIADTGHNVDGITYVVSQLQMQKAKILRVVLGMVSDKDISAVLALLPKEAVYYFCKAGLPRALDEKELQSRAASFGLMGSSFATVQQAYAKALQDAHEQDLVFVGGSTFVVAEVL